MGRTSIRYTNQCDIQNPNKGEARLMLSNKYVCGGETVHIYLLFQFLAVPGAPGEQRLWFARASGSACCTRNTILSALIGTLRMLRNHATWAVDKWNEWP